ncbi:hypothetical protein B0H67DRAFT_376795 [Lasiosphaeris hirsuta]|uniref:Uncharacterized protein n=1 Tax=Lasiosphaeris hirsuta TaxID=260670 RepID=A0AA40DMG4_9PEZI|nr:hypothetical protein B0H67DRAFT_376795 [Lasiosphaeris hirsuta]
MDIDRCRQPWLGREEESHEGEEKGKRQKGARGARSVSSSKPNLSSYTNTHNPARPCSSDAQDITNAGVTGVTGETGLRRFDVGNDVGQARETPGCATPQISFFGRALLRGASICRLPCAECCSSGIFISFFFFCSSINRVCPVRQCAGRRGCHFAAHYLYAI